MLLVTFLLTIFEDLAVAIAVGVTLGAFLFLHRMAEAVEVKTGSAAWRTTWPTRPARTAPPTIPMRSRPTSWSIGSRGAFFFGAAAAVSSVLDRIGEHPKVFVLDFSDVPLVDSTAGKALEGFVHKLQQSGTHVYFAGAGT